jgi:hypothetical protein
MNGFDRTPEGEELIAMLRRAAPPRADAKANAARALQRVRPQARVHWLGWVASAGLVAAAAAVAVIVLFPPSVDAPDSGPAPKTGTPAARVEVPKEGISVGVRAVNGAELTLDAGLTRGLRVGDELSAGESHARITAVGIFQSLARVEAGKPARGDKMLVPLSEAIKREQRYDFIGGDPGALYDFGAVLEALPPQEARVRGISNGRALVVVETIGAILRDKGVETSLAGQLGLQKGDVVIACNGLPASDIAQFVSALDMSRRGGAFKLRVLRGTNQLDLSVK